MIFISFFHSFNCNGYLISIAAAAALPILSSGRSTSKRGICCEDNTHPVTSDSPHHSKLLETFHVDMNCMSHNNIRIRNKWSDTTSLFLEPLKYVLY